MNDTQPRDWDDDRIDSAVGQRMIYTNEGGCVRRYDARHLMHLVRDDMQLQLDAANQRIAELEEDLANAGWDSKL